MNPLQALSPDDVRLRTKCKLLSKQALRKKAVQGEIDAVLNFMLGMNQNKEDALTRIPKTVGLSANQIGINLCACAVDLSVGRKGFNDVHVLVNPEIIWKSKTMLRRSEGCVNLPQIFGMVERAKTVKVKALDRSGNELLLKFSGWPAILLQHEIDHLNGHLFIDHLEDPTQADLVTLDTYKKYKRGGQEWLDHVDVSHLVKET